MSTSEPPEPGEEEQEAALERRREKDAQRGPGHDDPKEARTPEE